MSPCSYAAGMSLSGNYIAGDAADQQPERLHRRCRFRVDHGELHRGHQVASTDHLLPAGRRAQVYRSTRYGDRRVLAAVQAHPVTWTQHRPHKAAHQPTTRPVTAAITPWTDAATPTGPR